MIYLKKPNKIYRFLSIGNSIIKAKIFNKKIPIFVSWELTNRCNLRCKYCDAWKIETNELAKETIFSMIDELKYLGTQFISFTGGEPLLREDIGEIIDYCKYKLIYTTINSNGFEFKEKFSSIKNVDLVILSLDGSGDIHDLIRGKGSYEKALEAAEMVRKEGIELNFAVTLTKFNLDQTQFLINKTKEYNATVTFQPSDLQILYSDRDNPIIPKEEKFKKTIQQLISYKKSARNIITNSFNTFRHFYYWPHKKRIKCASGYIACRIKSNGDICLCNRIYNKVEPNNCLAEGIKKAFYSLPQIYCDRCWCAQRVELNLLFALKMEVLFNNLFLLSANRRK